MDRVFISPDYFLHYPNDHTIQKKWFNGNREGTQKWPYWPLLLTELIQNNYY